MAAALAVQYECKMAEYTPRSEEWHHQMPDHPPVEHQHIIDTPELEPYVIEPLETPSTIKFMRRLGAYAATSVGINVVLCTVPFFDTPYEGPAEFAAKTAVGFFFLTFLGEALEDRRKDRQERTSATPYTGQQG